MELNLTDAVIIDNIYVDVLFGRDLFDSILQNYGKEGWNVYSDRLRRHDIWAMYSTPEPTYDDERCMPVCLRIDLAGEDFTGKDLSGLDLRVPEMERADFSSADLRGARLGSVEFAPFRGARLDGADFDGAIITGADFQGGVVKDARFERCGYLPQTPPLNLPDDCLSHCRPFPSEWADRGDPTADEPRDGLVVKQAELRSFWGKLR